MSRAIGLGVGTLILGVIGVFVGTREGDASFLELPLTDYAGETRTLAEFEGAPLVVNAWASWCPFCTKELPDFAALQNEFPRIRVIAVNRAESLETSKEYTDERGITGSMTFLLDEDDALYRGIGGFSMPETLFLNEAGEIVFHKRGPMTLEEMRSLVREHLNK